MWNIWSYVKWYNSLLRIISIDINIKNTIDQIDDDIKETKKKAEEKTAENKLIQGIKGGLINSFFDCTDNNNKIETNNNDIIISNNNKININNNSNGINEKCLEDSKDFLIDTQKKKMVKEERKNNILKILIL